MMVVGLVILAACSQFDQITPIDEKEITLDDNLVQKGESCSQWE